MLSLIPVYLWCQRSATASQLRLLQISRAASTARLLRRPARTALSPHVAKSQVKPSRPARKQPGPWGSTNQTEARLFNRPRSRSSAEIKRSPGGKITESEKKDSPLYNALKMQRALAPMNYGLRTAIKTRIADITSFDQFPLLPVVRESIFSQALPGLNDITPTPIQRLAIPALLESDGKTRPKKAAVDIEPKYRQYLLAAETGSGKTLAYLLPIIDAIKRADIAEKEEEVLDQKKKAEEREKRASSRAFDVEPPVLSENLTSSAGRPKAIILVPTSELVTQIGAKVKALSHTVKYRSGLVSSADTALKIRRIVFNPHGIDILVSTPHLLASIAKNDPNILSRVSHLVIDEADSLLDRSFSPATIGIIDKVSPSLQQLILCSATIPRSLDSLLRKRYPDIRRLATPKLHAISRRVQLGVVDIDKDPYRGNRNLACADVIWSLGKAGDSDSSGPFGSYMDPAVKKIIVFVNEREEAAEVAKFLFSKGIDAIAFSRDSSERRQSEVLEEFTHSRPIPTTEDIILAQRKRRLENAAIPFELPDQSQQDTPSRRLQKTKVLVTTDLGSRGIDTLPVRTVILYHVPHTTIDFIHRLGRVGRMGRRGRGIVLVGKHDRKDIVREVREAMFQGQALI